MRRSAEEEEGNSGGWWAGEPTRASWRTDRGLKSTATVGDRSAIRLILKATANQFPSMPMTIEQIAEEALALPSEQRALLADRLVESLDAAEVNRIDRLWITEAKRRRDEVRQGLVQTIPGDEALARVRRSLGR